MAALDRFHRRWWAWSAAHRCRLVGRGVSLVTCAVGFGFFYLLFPGGAHFGMTVANFLAIYACMFEFFRERQFPGGAAPDSHCGAVAMPVLGFLGRMLHAPTTGVLAIIRARRIGELHHLPRLTGGCGRAGVGAASFALPRLELDAQAQGFALLAAMALIALLVVASVRDVVLVMIDVAMVFEGVAARLDRLVRR